MLLLVCWKNMLHHDSPDTIYFNVFQVKNRILSLFYIVFLSVKYKLIFMNVISVEITMQRIILLGVVKST